MRQMSPFALLLATAAFATPLAAQAADYDPPIYVDEAPEYKPVEIGSGWYLRGDVGYNVSDPVYDFTLFGEDTDSIRFGASGGFGYHFNDFLRADVNLGFIGKDEYDYDDGVNSGSASFSGWTGMLNGYVDLGTVVGVTPYVGGGVGVLSAKHEVEIDAGGIPAVDWRDRQYEFAYSLNAGLAYRVSDNLSVDIGYEYLNSPKTQYLDTDSFTVEDGVDFHRIKAGLRYELW